MWADTCSWAGDLVPRAFGVQVWMLVKWSSGSILGNTITPLWKHLQTPVFIRALFLAQIILKRHTSHALSPFR